MRIRMRRTCPTCGASVGNANFCPMCGTRLTAEPSAGFSKGQAAVAGLRDRARYAVTFVQTLSGARRQLAAIGAELQRLHGERRKLLLALGDAAYRKDEEADARWRDEIRALDERIEQEHERRKHVLAEASRRIDDERGVVAPTEIAEPPQGGE